MFVNFCIPDTEIFVCEALKHSETVAVVKVLKTSVVAPSLLYSLSSPLRSFRSGAPDLLSAAIY